MRLAITVSKKRTRGFETTGPVAALDVRVFGGGEQPLKRIKVFWRSVELQRSVKPLSLPTLQEYTTEPWRVESFF
jgi:hypothetical protein